MTTQTCTVSGQDFHVTDEDLKFYEQMGVPTPTLCPEERMRRRLTFRNFSALYHRDCPGTGKKVICMYHPEGDYQIYDNDYWWSDHWDAGDYAKDFSFDKTFFAQFEALNKAVPKMARVQQGENPNSRYTNCASYNKDSYLIFTANQNENCMYAVDIQNCQDCYDNYCVNRCELCYECLYAWECYGCTFSQRLKNCYNCEYCFDCIGCKNCFGCIGLRQGEYYILNKKVDQKSFKQFINNTEKKKAALANLKALFLSFPRKYIDDFKCENSTGDHISYCKNTTDSFDCAELEDCKYCQCFRVGKSCYDVSYYGCTQTNELCYECEGVGHGVFNLRFCKLCWGGCQNLDYCFECFKCEDCFGCSGLKNKRFCILNKQYTEAEYHRLKKKIIEYMTTTREWGEFFPISLSPFGYNESIAFDYMPMDQEACKTAGYPWQALEETTKYEGSPYKVPATIEEVHDEVLNQILVCQATGKHYRIMRPELAFHPQMQIPLSPFSPQERHKRRLNMRNPWKLWDRSCDKCDKSFQTTYAPHRPEKILCEEFYLNIIN